MPARTTEVMLLGVLFWLAPVGCAFGPRALEKTHGRYNESVRQVYDEQFLLNLVRLRYTDSPADLDIASIAAQYELSGRLDAQPFFSAQADAGLFRSFSQILPFASVGGATRPTVTLSPADDQESVQRYLTPLSRESLIFLSETGWAASTIFRLWVDSLNGIPNAVAATGPTRDIVPEFEQYLHVMDLLQIVQDRGDALVVPEEQITELGPPVKRADIPAQAVIDAAKNGYEYRPDTTGENWVLAKRTRRLVVQVNPAAHANPEWQELLFQLNLRPGLPRYEVNVGLPRKPYAHRESSEPNAEIDIVTRSTAQVLSYLSHGVNVPADHIACGIVKSTVSVDGQVFDWPQVTAGLFEVHSCRQLVRPANAYVAVKYRDHWFYIDDRDHASKATFLLMLRLSRLDFSRGKRQGGPVLTLPVGR